MRLIDADALANALFDQRKNYPQWVADVIGNMPDAVVRCKDCKHRGEWKRGDFSYIEFPEDSKCPGQSEDFFYSWRPDDNWFCADGERREEDG